MFPYAQQFASWMFSGASQTVIDFAAVVLTFGILVFALLPLCLIIKYIFKR